MKSTHGVAYENEIKVLNLLHRFGHVRQCDISRAIWPNSDRHTAETMAQRTIARLLRLKQIFRTRNRGIPGYSCLLASAGVNRIDGMFDVKTKNGRGLTSVTGPQFVHRELGTRYLIEQEVAGMRAYGEYAVYRGMGGFTRDMFRDAFKKIPDGLVLIPGAARGLDPGITAIDWIEVENYYKPPAERDGIYALFERIGDWIGDPRRKLMLDRVVCVYSSRNEHKRSLISGIARYVHDHKIENPQVLASIALAECQIQPPLIWLGCEETHWLAMQNNGLAEKYLEYANGE